MLDAKVDKEVIKAYINGSSTAFNLTASDIITLKESGVPDDVVTTLLQRDAEIKNQLAHMANAVPVYPSQGPGAPAAATAPETGTGYDYTMAPGYADSGYSYASYPYYYPYYTYPYYSYYSYGYPFYYASCCFYDHSGHCHYGHFDHSGHFHHDAGHNDGTHSTSANHSTFAFNNSLGGNQSAVRPMSSSSMHTTSFGSRTFAGTPSGVGGRPAFTPTRGGFPSGVGGRPAFSGATAMRSAPSMGGGIHASMGTGTHASFGGGGMHGGGGGGHR
jgi:hypothetical protein